MRRIVEAGLAVLVGAGVAMAGVPLGVYDNLACTAWAIGCDVTPPAGRLPVRPRLLTP